MSEPIRPADDEARQAEFVQLLTAHQPDIYLYLRSLVLDPDEASEILQDANLVLWEKRGQFELGTNFRAWAFQIARYKLLQRQAQRHRAGVCFSDALVDELTLEMSGGEEALGELIDELRRCVAMLSARDRELIGRRYAPRATCDSVAQALGRPVRWVYKAVSRIRKALFECIRRESAKKGDDSDG
jgi:RNA polymerase sigma-70 factor, ECF subfamily